MKPAATILTLCAVLVGAYLAFTSSEAQVPPDGSVMYVGFADDGMNPVLDNDWTNYWQTMLLVSADVAAPLDQWLLVPCTTEMRSNRLVFPLPVDAAQKFCRVVYQPK